MIDDKIATYEGLAAEIKEQGDVATARMITLRNIHGADRLGSNVVSGIQDELAKVGLGHAPPRLPNGQWDVCLLFTRGSTLAGIYDALHTIAPDTDEILRPLLGDRDAGQTLKRVRELVCG